MPLVTGVFAQVLRQNRERFNAQFAAARRSTPALDHEAFARHLSTVVAPIVEAVHREYPERTHGTAEALYDLSLQLLGAELMGEKGRYPAVDAAWTTLFPHLPRLLGQSPRALAGAICNALYNLSSVPGANPHQWLATMVQIGPLCPDVESFLQAGQVVAWRCGMAHYRASALRVGRNLSPNLARAALGVAESSSPLENVWERLNADPWLRPTDVMNEEKTLRVVARVGAFRGFGGVFCCPPRVDLSPDGFVATDVENSWLLTADAFGATCHRVSRPASRTGDVLNGFRIEWNGRVSHNGRSVLFEELAGATSFAADGTTLAVTVPLSHAVFLVAESWLDRYDA